MRFINFFTSFLKNTTAVVGLEFSLVLPVLLTLFLGMVEITNMIYAKGQISNTAEMFQNLIARPQFGSVIHGNDKVLSNINKYARPIFSDIAKSYSKLQIGFAVYVLDSGNVIPEIAIQIPTVGEPSTDEQRTLYVAYHFEEDKGNILDPRLDYVRTGNKGSAINEAYFNKNKLKDDDIIYKGLGGKDNYDALSGDQYLVVEMAAKYTAIFSASEYTGLTKIINMHIENTPRIIADRFTELPDDGGDMH